MTDTVLLLSTKKTVIEATRTVLSRRDDSTLKHFFHIIRVLTESAPPSTIGWRGKKGNLLKLKTVNLEERVEQILLCRTALFKQSIRGWVEWVAHAAGAAVLLSENIKSVSQRLLAEASFKNDDVHSILVEKATSIGKVPPERGDCFGETQYRKYLQYIEKEEGRLQCILKAFLDHTQSSIDSGLEPYSAVAIIKEIKPFDTSRIDKENDAVHQSRLKRARALEGEEDDDDDDF